MQSFVAGGAGFIGSHLVRELLRRSGKRVIVYDNFSAGRMRHFEGLEADGRLQIVRGDVKDLPALIAAMHGSDTVFHLASNPDISKAITQPNIDFWEGTYLTQNILEAMRQTGAGRLIYASGSGVYGDTGTVPVFEDYSPMRPTSTYGASKLAGEALISSYCCMFGLHAAAFRFANVVGPRQTHGVTFDFVRRLIQEPARLRILGDGNQSKSYVHVDDVLDAMLIILNADPAGYEYYNVATQDYVTVREIADLTVSRMGLSGVHYEFTGGARGWRGDIPIVRFDTSKIRARGWTNKRTSIEALTDSIDCALAEAKAGICK